MKTIPQELIDLGRYIGARVPSWTQGAGGNISMKTGEHLWVKATGGRLDKVGEAKSMARANLEELRQGTLEIAQERQALTREARYSEMLKASADQEFGTPSMEAGFHAALPKKIVLHFHALVGILLSEEEAMLPTETKNWMAVHSFRKCEFFPAIQPGFDLTSWLNSECDADVILLRNHGIVFQADTVAECWTLLKKWRDLEYAYCRLKHFDLLAEVLREEEENGRGQNWMSQVKPSPVKLYFPDVAVFIDRLKAITLESVEKCEMGNRKFEQGAIEKDLNAAEIWMAVQLLHHHCPTLSELPLNISSVLGNLPTELVRKGK